MICKFRDHDITISRKISELRYFKYLNKEDKTLVYFSIYYNFNLIITRPIKAILGIEDKSKA